MTYDQILTRMGLDQGLSEALIVLGVITIVIGFLIILFWQYIVAGAVVFAVLTVFSHHIEPTKVEDVAEKTELSDKATFLDACKSLSDKSDTCEEMWKDREDIVLKGAEEVVEVAKTIKLLDVDNAEYKSRRAAALKKPGAVVIQTTFSDNDR
jgi:hypothetical protein